MVHRVDNRCVCAGGTEGKDVGRSRFVDERIYVVLGLNFARNLQGLWIENHDLLSVAVSDVSLADSFDYDNSVAALKAADFSYDSVIVGIKNHYFRAVRNVHASRIGIHRDVVE